MWTENLQGQTNVWMRSGQKIPEKKDTALRKVQEVQRLTNNHVANLDVIISDLRHENAELGKTLTYLNGHEAVIFKVRRKLGQAFNRCYPKGTLRRKKLGY